MTQTCTFQHLLKLLLDGQPFEVRGICYSPTPINASVHFAPYGDYFVVLSKWVFAPKTASGCSVQVSVGLAWSKDTWFRKPIETNAIDELRETYQAFLPLVRKALPSSR